MHDNVDISRELAETRLLFDSVLIIQGGGAGGAGANIDAAFGIASDILDKVRRGAEPWPDPAPGVGLLRMEWARLDGRVTRKR